MVNNVAPGSGGIPGAPQDREPKSSTRRDDDNTRTQDEPNDKDNAFQRAVGDVQNRRVEQGDRNTVEGGTETANDATDNPRNSTAFESAVQGVADKPLTEEKGENVSGGTKVAQDATAGGDEAARGGPGPGSGGSDDGVGQQSGGAPGEQGIARDTGRAPANDPFQTDSPSQRTFTDPQRRRRAIEQTAADSNQLDENDIVGFRETDAGELRPLLTADAKRELAREQVAEDSKTIEESEIKGFRRTSDGMVPVLSNQARLEQARENFEIDRDPQRVFSGTEEIPLGLTRQDFKLTLEGGQVRATLTKDARRELEASTESSSGGGQTDGGAFDASRLLQTQSAGAQFFGTAGRERAIEQEAVAGSPSAALFVGGEAIEAAGVDATKALDQRIPDFDQSVTVPSVGPGGRVTDVEANPRIGIGTEGKRLTQQLRNVVVGAPTGIGIAGGAAPKVAGDFGLRAEQALGADVDDRATIGAAGTGAAVASAGGTVATGIREEPVGAAADLAIPAGVSRVSPVRVRRFDVPEQSTAAARVTRSRKAGAATEAVRQGQSPRAVSNIELSASDIDASQTVTGIRVETPAVAQRLTGRSRGRTVAGFEGNRPTIGSPAARAEQVDLTRVGRPGRQTFEPNDPFQTDVLQTTARGEGGSAAARTQAVERLIGEAQQQPIGRELPATETIVREARAVPDDRAPQIANALVDTDATIFGSAAAGAQVRNFRQPRDLDVMVPDEQAARQRFADALEGSNADVGDVFDIKELEEAPGRARGGEPIKFGRQSRPKLETDRGVQVNPVEEELTRKTGASGIFREPEAAGTSEFDVGPEPRAAGRADVREKDVTDTQALGRELLGEDNPAVREFEAAFGLRETPPEVSVSTDTAGLRALVADERGQLGAGRRRIDADGDADGRRGGDVDESAADEAGTRASPGERSPTTRFESPSPRPRSSGVVLSALSGGVSASPSDASSSPGERSPRSLQASPGPAASPDVFLQPGGSPQPGGSDQSPSPAAVSASPPPASPANTTITTGLTSGGSPTVIVPPAETRGSGRRVPSSDTDKEQDVTPLFGGRRDPQFTSFINPLTGDTLTTERRTVSREPDEPAFVGFFDSQ